MVQFAFKSDSVGVYISIMTGCKLKMCHDTK
jgi:hypothetical protein